MAISHSTTAAVYEFDAVITSNGYADSTICDSCPKPDDYQETTGQNWDIGESVGVSFEYNVGNDSANGQNYYALSISEGGTSIASANSLDSSVTTNLNNGTPESGESDQLSVSFLQEYESGDDLFSDTIVEIVFIDSTGTVFSGEDLPEMLDLEDFSTISVGYDFYGENYQTPPHFTFYDEFLNAEYTPTPVPLPPVVYLFVSGIIGLLGITRRKTALS
jgi:hypothetical protein